MTVKKILLVDDSETILQMEQMILRQDRYELATARDGQEGIAKALQFKTRSHFDGRADAADSTVLPHCGNCGNILIRARCRSSWSHRNPS